MATTGNEIKATYDHYATSQLMEAFEQGPQRINEAINGLSEPELKSIVIPGKWSIFEIVIHLAEGEIIGACRFRQALCDHPEIFPYYQEDVWAKAMQYQKQSLNFLHDNIAMFDRMRRTTSNLLNRCSPADWKKSGIHPRRGRMTVRQLLELYADHSERHISQILQRRELLGKQSPLKILLEDRLY